MVLGILSVMVLMAVAFAISMRTERVAAGNYADSVRARQLVQVGLARALADIQNNLSLPDRIVVGRDGNPKITVMGGGTWELNDWVVFETPGAFPAPIETNKPYKIIYSAGTDVRIDDALTTEGTLPDNIAPSEIVTIDGIIGLKTSGMRLYYRGTPVYLTGNLDTYYVIPIDQTHIKLANSYDNALQGNALPLAGGTLNLKPIHSMIPIHLVKDKDLFQKTITLDKTCKFKTGDAVTYYDPPFPYSTVGNVYYVRVVETNVIQLADSYNKAILGDCVNVSVTQGGYFKKHGFLAPPWPGYASYTTNALQSIGAKYELVTFDTALNQVVVANRYHSGDCFAFTTNTLNNLPSLLNEKEPYYVVGISTGRIKLAKSIDDALASTPQTIALGSGGSGSPRLYLTILSGEVTNCVPMSLYAGVSTAACEAVTNTYMDITSDNILLGKYRYLVADCSGLLDANFIGSSSMERRFGINTEEIAIENLPEINPRKNTFLNNRSNYKRYETINELAALDNRPDDLFVYSYSPAEKWNTDMLNYFAPVNLAGDYTKLTSPSRHEAILNAFRMAGITEADHRECLYRSLIDYVDEDNIPNNYGSGTGDLTLPSNEKIPMINEVKFYHKLTTVTRSSVAPITRKYNYEGNITFEIWWPFVNRPSDTDFTFEYTIDCTPAIISDMSAPGGAVLPSEFTPQIWEGDSPPALNLPLYSDGPFITKVIPVPLSTTADLVDKKIDYLQLDYTITAKVKSGADEVDKIVNYTTSFRIAPSDVQGEYVEDVRDFECLDPRYNWGIGNDKYWRYVVQSFVNPAGSTVLSLSDYLAGRSFENGDPIAIIPGASLPSTTPSLIPGKIYWVVAPVPKINGNIQIKDETGTIIMFNAPGRGNNYIKAVLDQCSLSDLSKKRFITARPYRVPVPPTTKIRFSGANAADEYTVTSYDPKTRIFNTAVVPSLQSEAGNVYVRDVNDDSVDSLGNVNYWTLSYLDGQTHDGDPYMCVENAQLKSVAELGRLIYSYSTVPAKIEPWANLTFYGANTNQLLDVFAIGDDANADFVATTKHGLLNPNASNINCLATVLSGACVDDFNDTKTKNFYTRVLDTYTLQAQPDYPLDRYYFTGMPITMNDAVYYVIYLDHKNFKVATSYKNAINSIAFNPPPGDGYLSPAKLTMPMAQIMAQKMAGGSSTNYSQLARTLSDFNFGGDDSKFPYPATELEKESLLGHNIGLLSLRQNMFAIIIEAQVASGGNIPRNPVKQRAVALVWRDPYTGEMFVRSIKWLRD